MYHRPVCAPSLAVISVTVYYFLFLDARIHSEVSNVMGSGRSRPLGRMDVARSMAPPILFQRKTSRSRSPVANPPHKRGRVCNTTFQKMLQVFKYNRQHVSRFSRTTTTILASGLLNPIALMAEEREIRAEIGSVIRNLNVDNYDFTDFNDADFEFMQVVGKNVQIPNTSPYFTWTGQAVKSLAGQGALYVRLVKDFHKIIAPWYVTDPDPDFELPTELCPRAARTASSTSQPLQTGQSPQAARTASSTSQPLQTGQSPQAAPTASSTSQPLQTSESPLSVSLRKLRYTRRFVHDVSSEDSDEEKAIGVDDLIDMMTNHPPSAVKTVYDLCNCNFDTALECLVEGPTLDVLQAEIWESKLQSIRHFLAVDPDNLVGSATSHYKSPSFDPTIPISIRFGDQPAIDAGGPRRHFFSKVLKQFANEMGVFEGKPERLLPKYTPQVQASGLMKVLGKIVCHAIVLEGIGMPCLAPICFEYIAIGCKLDVDKIVPHILSEDFGERICYVVDKVRFITVIVLYMYVVIDNLQTKMCTTAFVSRKLIMPLFIVLKRVLIISISDSKCR